jgi:uncharacterized repeat protein (TIGR04076 family)
MFKVKATMVGFLGDEEKYPCHFQHKIGDEFIYDGEKFVGRICGHVASAVIARMMALHASGPRVIPTAGYYHPFWYAPVSAKDPGQKKYDGLGFRNVFKTYVEPKNSLPAQIPDGAFQWPPRQERNVSLPSASPTVVCGDTRTSAVFKIEAFDLNDKGDGTPYFRREMTILHKVIPKPGIMVDKILKEFTKDEIEIPYPALSPAMVQALVDELELIGYLKIQKGKASVTKKGEAKLNAFKKGLSAQERKALKM